MHYIRKPTKLNLQQKIPNNIVAQPEHTTYHQEKQLSKKNKKDEKYEML